MNEPVVWKDVAHACELVMSKKMKRVDGDGFIVYRVGNMVRIDIKEKA